MSWKNFASFAAVSLSLVACNRAPFDVGAHRAALTPNVILSEIFADPPGADANNEFVELQCTPGASLAGYWFVIIEGDISTSAPNDRGKVTFSKQLTGIACGTSGFVILQRGGVYDGISGTTYADNFFSDNIQNGSQTYLILDQAIANGTDVDGTDNDGVFNDTTLAAHVIDSVGFLDGTAGDVVYSTAVISAGDDTAAMARYGGTTESSSAVWWFGNTISNPNAPPTFIYDPANVSSNFPPGGRLSPGEANTPNTTFDLAPNLADLAGSDLKSPPVSDLSTVINDLSSTKPNDLTTEQPDLTGVVPPDLTGADLTGVAPDDLSTVEQPDLSEEPTEDVDLARVDLRKPTDLTTPAKDGSTPKNDMTGQPGDDGRGCNCNTTGSPSSTGFSLGIGVLLLALIRRRSFLA